MPLELYATIDGYRLYVLGMDSSKQVLKLCLTSPDNEPIFILRLYANKDVRFNVADDSYDLAAMTLERISLITGAYAILPKVYNVILTGKE